MEHDIATIVRAVAAAVPDRECYVQGDERVTFAAFAARANQVAHLLHERGLGCHHERTGLAGHESGQDHLGLYLHNCRELLEANVGAFAALVAPFNVNYRYTAAELTSLLTGQAARAVVFHERFAPTVAEIAPELPGVELWLEVPDGSGAGLAPGAEWWAEALDGRPTTPPPVTPRPDDLYILCTGGTTGTPKGVLWRQADVFVAAFGGVAAATRQEFASVQEVVDEAVARGGWRNMPIAPFIHGAAQWTALTALTHGNTVVVPPDAAHLDPAAVWATVERERVTLLQVVGDALARPLSTSSTGARTTSPA